ncbi:bifunctional phosphopantothenoylcysteine decarboxylase/phosphopantothenate--cysteine ligase CoaBC [Candidatus Galacturonibacter soehngenii]|uniref:Coenzyme A biosynthesis bifunctional protein CoaBC n=1 Tax=Candidatus Galacturonatibacter soehngenii TaxID=2307010 RepID=A0A7V7QLT0_9FIRM|nr:bifunctional phosphopantothenoylcysteine decarboxylase/phosphopantothenate--cysteine ligase CoaBC [Candidatus Galacturonibacter soehngenii]KAB1439527.1 bifunctional phosphopantothenoylcysteine decarboxylase/phosphopantothenate--cysteine ligase CoaBC [Candidatus Galacturonibacter soehngenii]
MLKGKTIILGVTGSIAAYKIASLASMLVKLEADVHVIMTQNAANFITPITFESLTGNKCLIDTFDRNFKHQVEHVSIAKKADVCCIAPASANVIGKMANGIADDMLTTTVLACKCKKIVAPAMNTNMYTNPIVIDNMEKLKQYGFEVIKADSGYLACGDTGEGKMPSPEVLLEYILKELAYQKDMIGKKVLVTAGPTREKIDPVRFISNHSSGKMGYAIAKNCMLRGANVLLITGKTNLEVPLFVQRIEVESAKEMFEAVATHYKDCDIVIKCAAVADYTPVNVSDHKIKKNKEDMQIDLEKTTDILKYLGENRIKNQYICGFSMETENMLENSKEKRKKKNIDMIVANNLKDDGAGFGINTNKVTIITEKDCVSLPIMSKDEVAEKIVNEILKNNNLK